MRALRTIPIIKEILSDIEKVCPNAIILNYVNPMVMLCMAINRIAPELNMVGLCHSVQGTAEQLAEDLNENISDISYLCAGINHMSFYLSFEKNQNGIIEDLYPRLRKIISQGKVPKDNLIRYEILKRCPPKQRRRSAAAAVSHSARDLMYPPAWSSQFFSTEGVELQSSV